MLVKTVLVFKRENRFFFVVALVFEFLNFVSLESWLRIHVDTTFESLAIGLRKEQNGV